MAIARKFNGHPYELMKSYKSKVEAKTLATRLRKQGMLVRIVRQKQYINFRGEEKVFWGVFARNKK